MFTAQKLDGTGSVHLVTRGSFLDQRAVTFCTGRSVTWMVGTDAPLTCKSCAKKATAAGIDVKALAV